MKTGDLVRFKSILHGKFGGLSKEIKWRVGLLVEYHSWEKIGTILWKGKILRIRAENIQKAGKKDWSENE